MLYGIEYQLYIPVNEAMEIRSTELTRSVESSDTLTRAAHC
jgi:NAD(P)H-nitrite reductase large subunit